MKKILLISQVMAFGFISSNDYEFNCNYNKDIGTPIVTNDKVNDGKEDSNN